MKKLLSCATLALAAALAAPAHATTVALAGDGLWNEFNVDSFVSQSFGNEWIDSADGSPLSFTFTIAAGQVGTLTVVDAGFAGDTFTVTNHGAALGTTSAVAGGTTDGDVVLDFDAALADPAYSRGVFTLQAGSYSISGALLQSVFDADAGTDLDATNGAVSLTLSAVPEPGEAALLLGGLAALAALRRRTTRNA